MGCGSFALSEPIIYIGGLASSYGISFLSANNQTVLASPTEWKTIKLSYNTTTRLTEVQVDGVVILSVQRDWRNLTERNFLLFAYGNTNTPNQYAFAEIEYSIFRKNGLEAKNFIAVPQGSVDYSNTPAPSNCMWDKVSGTYFENLGTGTFEIEKLT